MVRVNASLAVVNPGSLCKLLFSAFLEALISTFPMVTSLTFMA